jgi:hypothetical protein
MSKNELIQAVNTAFSGQQQRVLLAVLDYADATAIAAAGDIDNLPVATDTTKGIASFSTGLTVTDGVVTVDA